MIRHSGQIYIDARILAYRRGGIARYVTGLTEWLPRVAPDLSFRRIVNRPTERMEMADVRVRTPPHFRFERALLGLEITARRAALLHSPDFIAPIIAGSRRVVTVHDLAFLHDPELLTNDARRYYVQIEQSVAAADRVIAVSDYTARQLCALTHIDPGKIITIPNGVERATAGISREEAARLVRAELPREQAERVLSEQPVLLVVGTIEPRKRQQVVVRALKLVSTSIAPLIVLVGQRGWACEPIVAEIEQTVAAGQAIWLENAGDQLLTALYRIATLLVMPSLDEGFGLPVLEAMAAGLPVVAAKRGALPEVAGDAALLVDGDDPEDWAEAIASLIDRESTRHDMQRAGTIRAGQFSWERTARETAALYREVLSI